MTDIEKKREEIREIIDNFADDGCSLPDRNCEDMKGGYCVSSERAYKCLMEKLSIVGVVIKVGTKNIVGSEAITLNITEPLIETP